MGASCLTLNPASAESATASDDTAVSATIRQVFADYSRAYRNRDASAVAEFFRETASWINDWGERKTGRSEIGEFHRMIFAGGLRRHTFRIEPQTEIRLSDTHVVASGDWRWQRPDGVIDFAGYFSAVLDRTNEYGWKFADLRYASKWNRSRNSPSAHEISLFSEPPDKEIDLADETDRTVRSLEAAWNGRKPVEGSGVYRGSSQLIDVDGCRYMGGTQILAELAGRTGRCRLVPTSMTTLAPSVRILEGSILSEDDRLLGLPRVIFFVVLNRNASGWQCVFQMNRAPLKHLISPALWEPAIHSFAKLDAMGRIADGGIVFVGDSDVVGCDVPHWFPGLAAINRGFGGSQMEDIVFYAEKVALRHRPRIVVLSCGGNDIVFGRSSEEVVGSFAQFAGRLFCEVPACRLVVTAQHTSPRLAKSLPGYDTSIKRLNQLLRAAAENDDRITFVAGTRKVLHNDADQPLDECFCPDAIHFSDEGYRRRTGQIRNVLNDLDGMRR